MCKLIALALSLPLSIFSIFSISLTPAFAAGASRAHYALAQNAYQHKQFSQALQEYDRALQSAAISNKAAIHYMKANCLMQLNQPVAADQEYASAELLAPGSQTATYCAQARTNIRRLSQAPGATPLTKGSKTKGASDKNANDDANEDNEDSADDSEPQKTTAHSTAGKKVSPGTLDLIARQAALAQKRALDIGSVAAENERIKAANEARSLQARLERAASTPKNGSTEPVALSPAQMEEIKSQAAQGSEQLKQAGEWRAQQRRQESEDKAEEIRRQAENLHSQLINYRPNINSDIKLNPVGTNLYIRNYSNGITPIMPMKAQTGSLPSYKNATEGITGVVRSNQTALKKIDERGTSTAPSSSLDVKGKVIGSPRSTQAQHP